MASIMLIEIKHVSSVTILADIKTNWCYFGTFVRDPWSRRTKKKWDMMRQNIPLNRVLNYWLKGIWNWIKNYFNFFSINLEDILAGKDFSNRTQRQYEQIIINTLQCSATSIWDGRPKYFWLFFKGRAIEKISYGCCVYESVDKNRLKLESCL